MVVILSKAKDLFAGRFLASLGMTAVTICSVAVFR
jgi:hypothetical protein